MGGKNAHPECCERNGPWTQCCAHDNTSKGFEIVRSRPTDCVPDGSTSNAAAFKRIGGQILAHSDEHFAVSDTMRETAQAGQKSRDFTEELPSFAPGQIERRETYEDGSTYEGQLVNGKKHGRGVWRSLSESYEGQWRHDHRHGRGRQTWDEGHQYEGEFQDGMFNGHGHMRWYTPEGLMVFEGQYVKDVKQGIGRYTWPDGRMYDGGWEQGKRSGRGTYSNQFGETQQGIWQDDRLERWCSEEEEEEQEKVETG